MATTMVMASMVSITAMVNVMDTDMVMGKKSRNKYLIIYNLFLEKSPQRAFLKQ